MHGDRRGEERARRVLAGQEESARRPRSLGEVAAARQRPGGRGRAADHGGGQPRDHGVGVLRPPAIPQQPALGEREPPPALVLVLPYMDIDVDAAAQAAEELERPAEVVGVLRPGHLRT